MQFGCGSRSAALLLFLLVVVSPPAVSATWYEYKSDNFVVYSDVSKRRVTRLIGQLERFRYGVLKFTGKENYPERVPVTYLFFENHDDLLLLLGPGRENVAGTFSQTWDGPLMVGWTSGVSLSGHEISFHEYVHHLMRTRDTLRYPRWYAEGFAELLASAELRRDSMFVGHAPKWRFYDFRERDSKKVTVRNLLDPNFVQTKDNANTFYAKSWLLTHYVLFGELSGLKSYREASAQYILDFANGKDPFESFEKHMGSSLEDIENELRKYRNNDRLKGMSIRVGDYSGEISQRKLSHNEAVRVLATRALDKYRDEAVNKFVSEARAGEPGWEEVRLLKAIFSIHDFQPKTEETGGEESDSVRFMEEVGLPEDLLKSLENVAKGDHEIAGLLGHYYYDLASWLSEEKELHDELNMRSIKFSQLAIDLRPDSLRAYEYLWRAQVREGHQVDAFRTMMAAYKYHPSHLNLNYHIAQHLLKLDRLDLSKPFLEKVGALAHDRRLSHWAQELLDQKVDSGVTLAREVLDTQDK